MTNLATSQMMDTEVVHDALKMYREAVQLVIDLCGPQTGITEEDIARYVS